MLQENPNVLVVQCMVHREALSFKSLPKDLMFVLDQVITIVNFINLDLLHPDFSNSSVKRWI